MRSRAAQLGATVYAPSPKLATDNAAMIARAALFRFESGDVAGLGLNAYAQHDLPHLTAAA
jgi:N6-L-threonylcarbamoyladenine synthase